MEYPFLVCGRVIQIYRYKAECTQKIPGEEICEIVEKEATLYFPTLEEAELTKGTITELDTAQYEWIDGIEVPDVPDVYAEAVKIYEMGETAYLEMINKPTDDEQLRADVDYIAIMTGIEL